MWETAQREEGARMKFQAGLHGVDLKINIDQKRIDEAYEEMKKRNPI